MSFSGEDRKEVFFFFQETLRFCKQPVYYENLRGHVSKASANIRKYVLTKCRGDSFLEYFKRRKNYFTVEDGKISLKEEFDNQQQGNSHSNRSKKKNSKGKYVRSTSFSYSSYANVLKGSDSNKNGDKEYEDLTFTYFRNRLIRKKKERLWAIEFNDLPKKVKRHLQLYYKNKVKSFLSNYPDKFVIDSDDESVSLANVCESNANKALCSTEKQELPVHLNQNSSHISADSDIKKASDYLDSIIFFVDILQRLNQPFPIEKLGGYFSQAKKEIKDLIKINYRSFKFFFEDVPLIFLKNSSGEVTLSSEHRKLIKAAKNLIEDAKKGLIMPPETPLKLRLNDIFQPKISTSRNSSLCLNKADSNNEDLSFEGLSNSPENAFEDNSDELKSDLSNESTDDFYDNYLMHSSSKESSNNTEILGSAFLRCVLTVELFCLEFIEMELNYIQSHEYKVVEYFMKVLDTSPIKFWKLSNLQGSIGNDPEVVKFMNKLYKKEKFVSFFQKHPQFEVDYPFVKLSLSDKTNCTDLTFSNEKNTIPDLKDLYELKDFKILLKETYAYLHEICKFLQDKNDIKIDRLSGILSKFPSCLSMIKSSKGQSLSEKNEYFLQNTMIFKFPKEGCIFFPCDYFFFAWFEKMSSYDPLGDFVNFSDFWKKNVYSICNSNGMRKSRNGCIDLEECCHNSIDIVVSKIHSEYEINYYDISKIIPEQVLLAMTDGNYYSKYIISILLESRKFRMKNGKISLQKVSENEDLAPSNNDNNVFVEDINKLENNITNGIMNEVDVQQNICKNDFANKSCSVFANSVDVTKHSKDSNTDYGFSQSLKLSQTENCEETETNYKNVKSKSNLCLKDNQEHVNLSTSSESQDDNCCLMIKNQTSEIFKGPLTEEESQRNVNLHNVKENLFSKIPLTDAENLNSVKEVAKCILSSKSSDLVKENEFMSESLCTFYRCENEVISKIDLASCDSDDREIVSLPSPLPEPEFYNLVENSKENQNLLPVCKSTDLSISQGFHKEEASFFNNQIQSPACSLNVNYFSPFNEQSNISTHVEVKSLIKDSVAENNAIHEVSDKNTTKSCSLDPEMEQAVSIICEEKESSKLKSKLYNKQSSNDNFEDETKLTKRGNLNNVDLTNNKDTKISLCSSSKDENCKAPEVQKKSFEIDSSQVSGFNDTKASAQARKVSETILKTHDSKDLQKGSINGNTKISSKQSFVSDPEVLLDTSLIKRYLNNENVSGDKQISDLTRYDVESVKQSTPQEVSCVHSAATRTSSLDGKTETSFSRTSSSNDLTSEYPMQPIAAQVVLLTNNSCIALADIKQQKQNIYFLRCVFLCEHQDDCSNCFSTLQIGDEVSCFVPLTELSQKMWIAFMVTKDNSENVNDLGIFHTLKESAKIITGRSVKSLSVSPQKSSVNHFGCQTEFPNCDNYCETYLNDDYDLCKTMKDSSCQTYLVSMKTVSVQTEKVAATCVTQTNSKDMEITHNGDYKKNLFTENASCQTSWLGKNIQSTQNVGCQTFSTGKIFMLKQHPI